MKTVISSVLKRVNALGRITIQWRHLRYSFTTVVTEDTNYSSLAYNLIILTDQLPV